MTSQPHKITVLVPKTSDDPNPIIHQATVSAPTNIACIKYWGKANPQYNTPINSSLSVSLDQSDLRAVTTASASSSFDRDRLWLNGSEVLDAATSKRFRACVDGVRALATDKVVVDTANGANRVVVTKDDWRGMHVHIASYNTFPTAAGLASSAAGYAALVAALVRLFGAEESYPGEFTAIARQGSGSACRSLYGGFVAWRAGGAKSDWSDSIAEQVADELHWEEVRAIILVVSDAKKETSSTDGMSDSVATSELLAFRAREIVPKRMNIIEEAIKAKDFESFGKVTMMDSNQFHATCLDTYPPIFYMNDVSRSVVQMIHKYNAWAGEIRAAYTFDAGPNAVLYTLDKHVVELLALVLKYYPALSDDLVGDYVSNLALAKEALEFKLCPSLMAAVEKTGRVHQHGDVKMVYCTKGGPGPQTLDPCDGVFDFKIE
jgi:diphosphomevalonate decarboxylase